MSFVISKRIFNSYGAANSEIEKFVGQVIDEAVDTVWEQLVANENIDPNDVELISRKALEARLSELLLTRAINMRKEKEKKTMMTNEEYVKTEGNECPKCYNTRFVIHDRWRERSKYFVEMSCTVCSTRWTEHYKLTGYEITDPIEEHDAIEE